MRASFLASRNLKEIVRDPISILLGLALPIAMLALFTQLGRQVPNAAFKIDNFAPAMILFGFAFLTMFSAMLLAKDKESSFLLRLFASPLSSADYMTSYAAPMIPLALMQCVATFAIAFLLGMRISASVLLATAVLLPSAILAVGVGLLMGTLLTQNQISGVGSIYIVIVSIFGGAWMDLNMLGGVLASIAHALPFSHGLEAARAVFSGDLSSILPHLIWVTAYAVVVFVLATMAFRRRMRA
jgi:ABC-2 type transport system permease protein